MAAIKKEELAIKEARYGLAEDGLTYQQRCSRIAAFDKGETWNPSAPLEPRRGGISAPIAQPLSMAAAAKQHPLWGKKLLISPMLVPDKNRNLQYEEIVGHEIEVAEADAGKLLYDQSQEVSRMVSDYDIIKENKDRPVVAKASVPKIGQEISIILGQGLPGVPVVRGNDGKRGYIWTFPTQTRQVGDTIIQLHGLKTLISQVWPELLSEFSSKSNHPILMYIDGSVLAASIPLTDALLKEHRRKELQDEKLGFV